MQSRKQCVLPIIMTMALWRLIHLDAWGHIVFMIACILRPSHFCEIWALYKHIYIYIYNYDYKIQVNYAINGIPEKAFRSDLSTQIKKTSPLTNYLLGITFSCYLFVLGSFVTFLLWWPIIAFVLIIYSVLSFCTIF